MVDVPLMKGLPLTEGSAPMGDPVASPCINICRLDAHGLCVGCRRTLDEIAEWPRASEARRREILRELPLRAMTNSTG